MITRRMSKAWFDRCLLDCRYDPMFKRMKNNDTDEEQR